MVLKDTIREKKKKIHIPTWSCSYVLANMNSPRVYVCERENLQ